LWALTFELRSDAYIVWSARKSPFYAFDRFAPNLSYFFSTFFTAETADVRTRSKANLKNIYLLIRLLVWNMQTY
jgi:hypothetical protein